MFEELIDKLKGGKYLTLETTPSHEPSFDRILQQIEEYNLASMVDGFSTTDNPLAKLKYNAILAAIKLQTKFNKPVITTMSMRDRNKIALQSDLLGANDFDIRSFLALTGDPANMSDQPRAKGVFEGNSNMLLEIIHSFNNGMDFRGAPFKSAPKPIYPFAVTNSYAKSFKTLEKRLVKKIKNRAVGIISQPVYDIGNAKNLIQSFDNARNEFDDERNESQLILGVFPITKLRTAQFLSANVPGIHVPDTWLDKFYAASKISEDEEKKVGMELSSNLIKEIQKIHPKIHLMTANRFDTAAQLLR